MRNQIIVIILFSLIFNGCNSQESQPKIPLATKKEYQTMFETARKATFVYRYKADFENALYSAKSTLAFAKKGFGKTDLRTHKAHKKLCEMYTILDKNQKYLRCLKSITETNFKQGTLETAEGYNKQALFYLKEKNFTEALDFANQALKIRTNLTNQNDILVADSSFTLARIYLALNQRNQAFPYAIKALNIKLQTWGEEDLRLYKIYNLISILYMKKNDAKKAFTFQKKAFTMMLEIRKNVFNAFGNKALQHYSESIDMTNLLQIAFISQKRQHNVSNEAFNLWVQYKGSYTENKIKLRRNKHLTTSSKLDKLTQVNKKYTTLFLKNYSDSLSKQERFQLQKLKFEKDNLEKELHYKVNQTKTINSLQISQKLADDELYIDFTKVKKDFYYMFTLDNKNHVNLSLITTAGQEVRTFKKKLAKMENQAVDLYNKQGADKFFKNLFQNTHNQVKKNQENLQHKLKIQKEANAQANKIMLARRDEEMKKKPSEREIVDYMKIYNDALEKIAPKNSIDTLIQKFRTQITNKKDTKILGQQLYSLLLENSIPNISNYKKLIISSDGQLNLLSFEALTTNDGKYLIQKKDIVYIGSGKAFLRAYEDKNKLPKDNKIVLLSNLNYNNKALEVLSPSSKETSKSIDNIFHNWSRLKALKSGQTEADFMERLYPKENLLSYKKNEGTKQLLYSLNSPKMLHLSTHSFYGKDNNQTIDSLLKSVIALSGYNAILSIEDNRGIMTALEFSTLNLLHTELVFFSSCKSSLGDIYNSEGVEGLTKSAKIAGAKRVISTLWAVSDEKTAELTKRFYTYLHKNKLGYLKSLKQSKLDMLHLHPYYWAGFIEYGLD